MNRTPLSSRKPIYENVRLGNLKASNDEINHILKLTGLSHLAEKKAEQLGENLSGGEKQRISIARALLKKSEILFVDEAFNNLDSLGKSLIENIFKQNERTIVFISHEDELLKYGNKVCKIIG